MVQYSDAVTEVRALRHRLDHDETTEVDLRRTLGRLFDNSLEGLAIARCFHAALERLEPGSEVTAGALTGFDSVSAVLVDWLAELAGVADAVIVDLTAIECLADVDQSPLHPASAARSTLIRELSHGAISKLEHAFPPVRSGDGSG